MFLELLLYKMMQVQGLCNDPGEDLVPDGVCKHAGLALVHSLDEWRV